MTALVDKMSIKKHGVSQKLDRRVTLTREEKQAIRERYFNTPDSEKPTMTSLAAKHKVDRRLIQFILFPERENRNKQQAKVRRKDGRYYDKEKSRKNMQNYRNYKRALAEDGKLIQKTASDGT